MLSALIALTCYIVDKLQEEAIAETPSFQIDLHMLGSMCAVLSGPAYFLAFFVRRDQQGLACVYVCVCVCECVCARDYM